jgi:hypothetical protein
MFTTTLLQIGEDKYCRSTTGNVEPTWFLRIVEMAVLTWTVIPKVTLKRTRRRKSISLLVRPTPPTRRDESWTPQEPMISDGFVHSFARTKLLLLYDKKKKQKLSKFFSFCQKGHK